VTTKRDGSPGVTGSRVAIPALGSGTGSGAPIAQMSTRTRARQASGRGGHAPSRLAGLLVALQIAELCHRQPLTLAQTWQAHRHYADMWRRSVVVPPPAVDQWGEPAAAGQPALGPHNWLSRGRLAWGALHLVIAACCLFTSWLLETVPRALITTGAIALAIWIL
jgi:hypothetical protein